MWKFKLEGIAKLDKQRKRKKKNYKQKMCRQKANNTVCHNYILKQE